MDQGSNAVAVGDSLKIHHKDWAGHEKNEGYAQIESLLKKDDQQDTEA